ncbi:arsenate reductase family protein [Gaopeijia maritima]|uniref:Arsenate reductase family protein n=1 Tax=Gaopeijia maritima TaxID=3119007 RepID=A0ABU9E616_9BACT
MIKFYGYARCSTCRNARKWLDARGIEHTFVDITADPPSAATLGAILDSGDYAIGELFNRSGVQYRELGMKDRLPDMSREEALETLAGNGKLVKRPIVTDGTRATVGFREDRFEAVWGS